MNDINYNSIIKSMLNGLNTAVYTVWTAKLAAFNLRWQSFKRKYGSSLNEYE